MTARAFVAGPASWNTLVRLERLPESRPHMVRAQGHHQALGGTSAGKALNLAGLGCDVTLRTLVGTDDAASSIRRRLDVPGLEVLAEVADGPSEQHLNLMTDAGERLSIYLDLPVLAVEHHAARTRAALAACDVALIDLAEHSRPLLAEARALGKPVWCDLHDYDGRSGFHQDWVDAADVLVPQRRRDERSPAVHAVAGRRRRGGRRVHAGVVGGHGRDRRGRSCTPRHSGSTTWWTPTVPVTRSCPASWSPVSPAPASRSA